MNIKKTILITTSLVVLTALAFPLYYMGYFMFGGSSRENSVKVDKFINLPVSEHQRLIEISQQIDEGHYGEHPIDNAAVPDEFKDFGFYSLSVDKTQLRASLYSSFDSGGEAVVDWSNPMQPTITFVEGDYGDIITKVYPKYK